MPVSGPELPGDTIERITSALNEGVDSLEELCQRTGVGRGMLHELQKEGSVQLPPTLKPWRYRPEIDVLIDEGRSFPAMAAALGCSRQNVYSYLSLSGQRAYWKQRRKEAKEAPRLEEKELRRECLSLLQLLKERTLQVAEQEGWAQLKAVEYAFGRKSRNVHAYSFDALVSLFAAYDATRKREEKLSVVELGKRSGISFTAVGRVLRAVGEEPMHKTRIRKTLSREQKEAIRRAYNLDLSASDVAYFLNVPCYVVSQGFRRLGPQRKRKGAIFIQRSKPPKTRHELTYRLASQLYEAQDAGLGVSDSAALLDTLGEVVIYAWVQRKGIERTIISALQVLYPPKQIDKPYLLGVRRDYVGRPWEHERYERKVIPSLASSQ